MELWSQYDTWIVVIGSLCAISCGLLGNFLILRRMSMIGDAVSHAVLPGIALAFLITGSRDSIYMLLGASIFGLVTVFLIHLVKSLGDLEEGTSTGVIFTSLFACGLILIEQAADRVDLDPSCVLTGALEYTPLDTILIAGWEIPRAAMTNAFFLLVNAVVIIVLYKELLIVSFDPSFADIQGFRSQLLHYGLMVLVAGTVVAAFESVGSILVIVMLIIPGACAYLLTDRLPVMILLSTVFACMFAVSGHLSAIYFPQYLTQAFPEYFVDASTSSAAMMGAMGTVIFLVVALISPKYGIISKSLYRSYLFFGIVSDDIIAYLYRHEEFTPQDRIAVGKKVLRTKLHHGLMTDLSLFFLKFKSKINTGPEGVSLTEKGRRAGRRLIRSHRLWETYLVNQANLRPDHVHSTAEKLEHYTDRKMRDKLATETGEALQDPHSADIPPEDPSQTETRLP